MKLARGVVYPLLFFVLLGGAGTTFFVAQRAAPPLPDPTVLPDKPQHVYLMDVAGWYEITPNEAAVLSAYDFAIGSMSEMPEEIGDWNGQPYSYGDAVEQWFENPDLAFSSVFKNPRGEQVWLSIFGNTGPKSYVLFEHTPITSYPAAGWSLLDSRVAEIETGGGALHVQRALLAKAPERRIVYYWYLWSDTNRDPARGVMTMRLHVPVTSTDQAADQNAQAILRGLFQVLPWHRF